MCVFCFRLFFVDLFYELFFFFSFFTFFFPVRLFSFFQKQKSLRKLEDGDVVMAVDVLGSPPPSYTVKIDCHGDKDVFLLFRRCVSC